LTSNSERTVDVVVVTADTPAMTSRCLERLTDAAIARVIVVHNGSSDSTSQAIKAAHPAASIITPRSPVGFAAASNRGAEAGGAALILFLNSDVLARPGAVDRLADELLGNPGAVAAGGRLVDPGTDRTQKPYAARPFPKLADFARLLLGLSPLRSRLPSEERVSDVEQPAGACLLVRRREFQDIGGFDESYWFWYEDVDLCRRLYERGRLLNVPDAAFEHLGGGTFRRWNKAMSVASLLHGMLRYAQTHFGRREQVVLALMLIVHSLPRAVLFGGELRRVHRRSLQAALELARGRPVAGLAGPG
jgi:N-acetylglucosaminyl-diphospho-decaprenol L-rhamnosyltransferase